MTHIDSAWFLLVMYGMLLAPKIAGALVIAGHRKASRLYGGRRAFLLAFLVEIAFSVAYAPIMMIQQTKASLRAALTRSNGWAPQRRSAKAYGLGALLSMHWLETLLGVMLMIGLSSGLVSFWLAPIALSLLLSVPLSAISAWRMRSWLPKGLRLENPISLRPPAIQRKSQAARAGFAGHLKTTKMPAE